MPMFDPDTFMQQTVDHPLETEYLSVPPGEYVATIDDFTSKAIERIDFEYKTGERAGTPGVMVKLTIPFIVQDETVKAEMQREKVVVSKQIILDLDEAGGIDWGKNKNVELGRVRAAVGQNVDGQPWSIEKLRGAGPVMIKVVHTEFERKDKTKGKRTEVERVVRIA
jgi:hypothetical protein